MFAIGLFENGSAVARNHGRQNENVTSEAHNAAARELATAGTVLLQNRRGMLPLDPTAISSVAVIGGAAAHETGDGAPNNLGTGLTLFEATVRKPWWFRSASAYQVLTISIAQLPWSNRPQTMRLTPGAVCLGRRAGVVADHGRRRQRLRHTPVPNFRSPSRPCPNGRGGAPAKRGQLSEWFGSGGGGGTGGASRRRNRNTQRALK